MIDSIPYAHGVSIVMLCSAKTSAQLRRQPFHAILMMEPAEDRPRDDPHLPWEVMAGDRGGRQPGRGRRKARSETRMRAATIVQPSDRTPIIPTFWKCATRGTRGADAEYAFSWYSRAARHTSPL